LKRQVAAATAVLTVMVTTAVALRCPRSTQTIGSCKARPTVWTVAAIVVAASAAAAATAAKATTAKAAR